MDRITAYFNELRHGDDYRGYFLTLNQIGHCLVGAALTWFAPLWLIVIGYLAWEKAQDGGEPLAGSLIDAAYVTAGAAAALIGAVDPYFAASVLFVAVVHGILRPVPVQNAQ